ncbi:MAG: serine/threonine protein kinase [Bdellovibrionales bacterium]|nr:serine/threonine protein kinase [Bdellovibrionales bacterium]
MKALPPSYTIVKKLGEGGMAQVCKAIKSGPNGFEKEVALKRILPAYARDHAFITMLSKEAKVHAQLHHPNIIQLYDFIEYEDQYYIVMEYVEGLNLKEWMLHNKRKGQVLEWQICISIILEILKALSYAHHLSIDGSHQEIIHRDISPHNILVSVQGSVKLSDFGIAQSSLQEDISQNNGVKGKFRYLSPEQIKTGKAYRQSDLFSLGIVFYELLTGVHPFDAPQSFQIMKNISEGACMPLDQFSSSWPKSLHPIVSKMLANNKKERYQNASELSQDLISMQDPDWSIQKSIHFISMSLKGALLESKGEDKELSEQTPILLQNTHSVFTSQSIPKIYTHQEHTTYSKHGFRSMKLWLMIFAGISVSLISGFIFSKKPSSIEERKIPTQKNSTQTKKAVLAIHAPYQALAFLNGKKIDLSSRQAFELNPGRYVLLITFQNQKMLRTLDLSANQFLDISWSPDTP